VPVDSEWDDLIFTVKAFQVEEAAAQLAERGVRPRRVWGFQNGVAAIPDWPATSPNAGSAP
jgi:ketopantoate reductase